jgi:hypothetical protein
MPELVQPAPVGRGLERDCGQALADLAPYAAYSHVRKGT